MGFIHDRLAVRGYDVDYLHREDVVSRAPLLRRFSFPLAVAARAHQAILAHKPYDLLNIHEPSAVPSLLFRRHATSPTIVVTTHGVERRAWELALEERRLGRSGPALKTRIVYPLSSLWQSRFGLCRADHVFCLSEEDEAFLVNRFHINERKITRIVPGADPLYADSARDRDYARGERLLFAGTWRKNKGIEDLVPAFTALRQKHPRLQLTVVGAGVSDDTVRLAFPESVRSAVTCVTTRNEVETAMAFAAADIFLLPSLFEGTPLTLMEAMTSGLPIVTTAVCGMKDVIDNGRNGLLVPIRSVHSIVSAVETLLENSHLRRQLGTSAREDGRLRYTWELSAERVAIAYERLLGTPKMRSARAS